MHLSGIGRDVATYVARRSLQAALILAVLSVTFFLLLHAEPGGPCESILNTPSPTSADRYHHCIVAYGLDRPLPLQYIRWLALVLHGDLGTDRGGDPVLGSIIQRLPATILLMGSASLLQQMIGFPLGLLGALKRHSLLDHLLTLAAYVGLSLPGFWLSVMLVLVVAYGLGWLPPGGIITPNSAIPPFGLSTYWAYLLAHPVDTLGDLVRHLILPVMTLAIIGAGADSRYMRSALLDVLGQDYVRTARAKGLPQSRVVLKHALRPALLPIITNWGLLVPGLVSGAVIVESIFGWPGMGQYFATGLSEKDTTRLLGVLLVQALFVLIGTLLADLLYAWADPRIRYDDGAGQRTWGAGAPALWLGQHALVAAQRRIHGGAAHPLGTLRNMWAGATNRLYEISARWNSLPRRLAHRHKNMGLGGLRHAPAEWAAASASDLSLLGAEAEPTTTRAQLTQAQLTWRRLRRHKPALGGAVIVALMSALAACSPLITPESPYNQFSYDISNQNRPPSLTPHWYFLLGTDADGHTLLAQIMWGARISLTVGFLSAGGTALIGVVVGAFAGYYGGWIDAVLMRLTDVVMTLPALPLLILAAEFWGQGHLWVIIGFFILFSWCGVARLVRSSYLSLRAQEFTEAARAVGVGDRRIIFRHLLPNALRPVIVATTLSVAAFIVAEAAIDFLGAGLQYPDASWGNILTNAEAGVSSGNWWWPTFPGLFLMVTVLALNFLGDGLADALDVRATV